jgi:hypothetical protein
MATVAKNRKKRDKIKKKIPSETTGPIGSKLWLKFSFGDPLSQFYLAVQSSD